MVAIFFLLACISMFTSTKCTLVRFLKYYPFDGVMMIVSVIIDLNKLNDINV